jgi:hypothetical protein
MRCKRLELWVVGSFFSHQILATSAKLLSRIRSSTKCDSGNIHALYKFCRQLKGYTKSIPTSGASLAKNNLAQFYTHGTRAPSHRRAEKPILYSTSTVQKRVILYSMMPHAGSFDHFGSWPSGAVRQHPAGQGLVAPTAATPF